jgi:hypothetical protein
MEQDIIVWTRTTAGEYSAKSAYQMQFEGGYFLLFSQDSVESLGSFQMQIFHVVTTSK